MPLEKKGYNGVLGWMMMMMMMEGKSSRSPCLALHMGCLLIPIKSDRLNWFSGREQGSGCQSLDGTGVSLLQSI